MLKYDNATAEDLTRLTEWAEADPFHNGTLKGEFWVPAEGEKGVKCITVSDDQGQIFNLKLMNVMRVYVQFAPKADPIRTARALREAFAFVAAGAKRLGYHEMLFDSVSKPLIRFFNKLGFKLLENTYKVDL